MVKRKQSNRYLFSLFGVNIDKVDQKYGIGCSNILIDEDTIPDNTTKIDDLDIAKRSPEIVSFLDESKRIRKCTVSMIDFSSGKNIRNQSCYKCYWDRNLIPEEVRPLGCPIKYVASKAIKSYHSEISKDKYVISEPITEKRKEELENRKDNRITIEPKGYYETDGVFCSFNCMFAFIEENKHNPLYRFSESLAFKMYKDLHNDEVDDIIPAPHWRELKEHGGVMSLEKFRSSFNKIEHIDHGPVTCVSLGRLYEERLKF